MEAPMSFERAARIERLRQLAARYVEVALDNITREYPHFPLLIATGPESYQTHRTLHPAFYGSFDWHSCVEMHWVIVRLLRLFPEDVPASRARATLAELLTAENLAAEASFFSEAMHRSLERPYGSAWLVTLAHELQIWDDPDGRRWSANMAPLVEVLVANLVRWLPLMSYPQRTGVHPNTAFALSRCSDLALRRQANGDGALAEAISTAIQRWFIDDRDYPAHYEPSGADFLSPALTEAELVTRWFDPAAVSDWLAHFLPGIADGQPPQLFEPARVADSTDGHMAHLHGLNLSRAWAFVTLAERLPAGDPRIDRLLIAAEQHAFAALPHVTGSDYMVEHWLSAYATLLLSA
jgi:hypothetical protein